MSKTIELLEARLQEATDKNTCSNGRMPPEEEEIHLQLLRAYSKNASKNLADYSSLCYKRTFLYREYFNYGRLDDARKMYLAMEAADRKYRKTHGSNFMLDYIDNRLKKIYRTQKSLKFKEKYSDSLAKAYDTVARIKPMVYLRPAAEWYTDAARRLYGKKDYAKSEALMKKAIAKYAKAYDDEYETPPEIMTSLHFLSELYRITGRTELQLKTLRKALSYAKMYAEWDCNFNRYIDKYKDCIKEAKATSKK